MKDRRFLLVYAVTERTMVTTADTTREVMTGNDAVKWNDCVRLILGLQVDSPLPQFKRRRQEM